MLPSGDLRGRPRIKVANPSDGEVFHWLIKLYAFAAICLCAAILGVGIGVYGYFAQTTPETPDLSRYSTLAPGVTRVLAADGSVLGEFAAERRAVLPYDKFPREAGRGVPRRRGHGSSPTAGSTQGTRASLWRNVTAGEFAQGGSTVTQQWPSSSRSEKTLARKAREAIVASRLEERYSKEEILGVYMNDIFLGAGAYGVEAAAQRYFSKDVWQLDVAEMAMIAGLAQAPSRDSPILHPQRPPGASRRHPRQDGPLRVPDRRRGRGVEGAPDRARPRRRGLRDDVTVFRRARAPPDRREVRDGRPDEAWAHHRDHHRAVGRQGRVRERRLRRAQAGPAAGLARPRSPSRRPGASHFVERQAARYGDGPLEEGRRYLALVEEVGSNAKVRIAGHVYQLPLRNMSWAGKWSARDSTNDVAISSASQALKVGDVVWVSHARRRIRQFSDWRFDEKYNAYWLPPREATNVDEDEVVLEQTPRVQTSILTLDHETGYVVAMVGAGLRTQRVQPRRPGVPAAGLDLQAIYYSAALDRGMSFDTPLNDIPRPRSTRSPGAVWIPVNLHGTIDYSVSLEHALVFSKNIPSVDVFGKVGAKEVEKWARQLGFTSPIIADRARRSAPRACICTS